MEFRKLGNTGLEISGVGFGAWEIAGTDNASGNLGPADDRQSVAAIREALSLGVNWIDTAPGYGCGHSEEVVGRAIGGMRDRPLIFTKCGFVWASDRVMVNNIEPASIRAEVDASLRRLRIDVIDLYQIHWVEPENDPRIEDAWGTMLELQREGKVAHVGVSNFTVGQLERAQAIGAVETLQPPYSLLAREVEADLLPYCGSHGIGVIVYSPLQTGLLGGSFTRERAESLDALDARRSDPNFEEPHLSRNLERIGHLRRLTDRWGTTVARAAVAWVLRSGVISAAIVGFRSPEQVDSLLEPGLPVLTQTEIEEIERIGWLPPDRVVVA